MFYVYVVALFMALRLTSCLSRTLLVCLCMRWVLDMTHWRVSGWW